MGRLEYRLASLVLRVVGLVADWLPARPGRVVLATARVPTLEGNLAAIHDAIRRRDPDREVVLLLEPYSYGLVGKIRYMVRLLRAMMVVRTAGLVVVDNAYLPIHVSPHRPRTTVVQVWHAPGALKRFGHDAHTPLRGAEREFLHRHYDWVVCSAEASRAPWAAAFGVRPDRVLPLGTPRTDAFVDPARIDAARAAVLDRYPGLRDRRMVLVAPTFRGRGAGKRAGGGLDGAALRAALPADHVLVLKTHPNLDPAATDSAGYDVVADRRADISDLLMAADVFVTDYSSSIFEWALLRRPLVLHVPDLAAYEADPGLYLDYRTSMIGEQAVDVAGVATAIREAAVDESAWDAFIARHLGPADGHASDRFVERFLPPTR